MDYFPTSVIFVVVFAVLGLVLSAISLPTVTDRHCSPFMHDGQQQQQKQARNLQFWHDNTS